MRDVSELRLAMQAAGFDPIPVTGKDARLKGWNAKHSPEEIAAWADRYPRWSNTGMRTCTTPTMDVDILHPEAAGAVEEMVKDWFDGRGLILVRFGLAPKRAIPFRTGTPFPKMAAKFVAPDGSKHKIEILGDGQQVVVDGIHPDTKQPYRWHGGWPGAVAWAELPEITEKEAAEFLALAADMLCERFGFKPDHTNGHTDPFEAHGAQFKSPLDVEAELDTLIREGTGGVGQRRAAARHCIDAAPRRPPSHGARRCHRRCHGHGQAPQARLDPREGAEVHDPPYQ